MKMHQGHHGANHPVKDLTTGKVEITSMNHGFAVDKDTLPKNVAQTHVSLFDGSNCGIALNDRPVFSVQYHPEASPGPRDWHYLFTRFVDHDAASEGRGQGSGQTQDRVSDVGLDQLLRFQAFGDLRECASPRRALPHHRTGHRAAGALARARVWIMAAARRARPNLVAQAAARLGAGGSGPQCARCARSALCRSCKDRGLQSRGSGGAARRLVRSDRAAFGGAIFERHRAGPATGGVPPAAQARRPVHHRRHRAAETGRAGGGAWRCCASVSPTASSGPRSAG